MSTSNSPLQRHAHHFRRLTYAATLVLVFYIPWRSVFSIGGASGAYILAGVTGLLWGIHLTVSGELRAPSMFHFWLLLFAVWSASTFLWSVNRPVTGFQAISNLGGVGLSLIVWDLFRTRRDLAKAAIAYVAGCYMVIVIEGGYYLQSDIYYLGDFIVTRNYVAAALVWGLPLAWYVMIQQDLPLLRVRQVFSALYIPASAMAILLTRSRQGMITFGVVVVLLLLMHSSLNGNLRRNVGLAGAFSSSAVAIAYFTIWEAVMKSPPVLRIKRTWLFVNGEVPASAAGLDGRFELYKAGLEAFQQHVLFGSGTGAYRTAAAEFGRSSQPHSTILAVAVETGVIGLVIFAAMLACLFKGIANWKAEENMMAASLLISYMMISLVKTYDITFTSIFLLTMVLLANRTSYE